MKKLLIALAAAATTAIGAFADTWTTGTMFSLSQGDPGALGDAYVQELGVDPTVAASASGFWTGLTNTVEVKAFGSETAPLPIAEDRFGSWEHLNYLSVKTAFNDPLFRKAKLGDAYDFTEAGAGNIYFEGNVKFTACDEAPDVSEYENAKLVMYVRDLSELEDTDPEKAAETNLYVVVGGTAYNCGNAVAVDKWTKLTIKMLKINDSGKAGFVIFLNDLTAPLSPIETIDVPQGLNAVAANYASKNQLFPASTDDTTIEGIGFAGQGALDQIAFTTEDLKPDPSIANIEFDTTTIATLYVSDGNKTQEFTGSPAVFEFDPTAAYTYWYTAQSGYISLAEKDAKALDLTKPVELDPAAKLAAKLAINGGDAVEYAELGKAIEDIASVVGTATLTLNDAVNTNIVIANENEATITIDLNGQTVTGVEDTDAEVSAAIVADAGTVIVTNSVAGGSVNIGESDAAVDINNGEIYIQDGVFNGAVYADGITGGYFDKLSNNEENLTEDLLPEGKAFVTGEGAYADYWTVGEKPDEPFDGGEGTLEKPYLISSVEALQELQTKVAAGDTFEGKYFQQTEEIDLAGIVWEGIGTPKSTTIIFNGVYDGNSQIIKNITYARMRYNGLFGNLGGTAQVKNLTLTVAGIATTGIESGYGFGAVVGFTQGTDVLIENITVNPAVPDQDSILGKDNMAGIGARLEGKVTLLNCTNNLNISTTYSKIGGMCAIASNAQALGGVAFINCVNNATITGDGVNGAKDAGSDGIAGILGYIQGDENNVHKKPLSFVNCQNNGTLQHIGENGTSTSANDKACIASFIAKESGADYTDVTSSGNTAKADYRATTSGSAPDGLRYATVDDKGVATFIADAAVVKGGTYKVMAPGAAPVIALGENETITFDVSLATIDDAGITVLDGSGLELVPPADKTQTVWVYSTKAAGPVVPVDDDKELDDKGKANVEEVAKVFGDDLETWAKAVYGDGGKIPAAKLNATTPALIAVAQEFNLPIMTEAVTVTVEAAEGGFTFKIVDGEPINVQAAKLQSLIKYAAALETGFGDSTGKVGLTAGTTSFDAKFTTPDAAAGFMKVDMTVK